MIRVRLVSAALALLALGLVPGLTGANAVPATSLGAASGTLGPDDLKPAACGSLALTAVAVGNGGNAAELVLGSAGNDTLRGMARDDCIVGGAGNDALRGDAGSDVCIGGPGTDTFHASCESQIQ